jgi:hypothetical protein
VALTGFVVNHVCAADAAAAAVEIASSFPALESGAICSLASVVFTAPATFDSVVTCSNLNGGKSFSASHALTFVACDPASSSFDYVSGAGFWSFAMAFVILTWWSSKAIKSVWDVVRAS